MLTFALGSHHGQQKDLNDAFIKVFCLDCYMTLEAGLTHLL